MPHSAITGTPIQSNQSGGSQAIDGEAYGAECQSDHDRAALLEQPDRGFYQETLHQQRGNTDTRQEHAHRAGIPAESVVHVQNGGAGKHHVRETDEKETSRQTGQHRMRAQQLESAQGIGILPLEWHALVLGQRLRQHEQAPAYVGQRQHSRRPRTAARGEMAPRMPPSAGPSTKPMPNAAPSNPKLAARFSGGVTSEM